MKNQHFLWFHVIALLGLSGLLHAELLVVKKNIAGLAPLTSKDSSVDQLCISNTLLKYQWPMCTIQSLSDREKKELLTPNLPYAEEKFIQKKLQECSTKQNFELGVLFVPTALYELFCLTQLFKDLKRDFNAVQTPLSNACSQCLWTGDYGTDRYSLQLEDLLNVDPKESGTVFKNINALYDVENKLFFHSLKNLNENFISSFFHSAHDSASSYVNQKFTEMLFNLYPELAQCCDASDASKIIQEKSLELSQKLIEELVSIKDKIRIYARHYSHNEKMQKFVNKLDDKCYQPILAQVITLEYEAREQNKALLLRGTSCQDVPIGFEDDVVKHKLVGSTIKPHQCRDIFDKEKNWKDCEKISLLQAYKEQTVRPYSISFGNSLFAGFIRDSNACAYHYLTGSRTYKDTSESDGNIAGYALLVDKKAYDKDRNSHLLFIPPLSSIASLMSCGEFFHPRTTAATMTEKNEPQGICGMFWHKLTDPAEVILISKDPFVHAEQFSEFIAKNGKIIHSKDDINLTAEDKELKNKVLEEQIKAAQKYKEMKILAASLIAKENSELLKG